MRLGCDLLQLPTDVFNDPALKRAKTAVLKRGSFIPRQKLFIGRHMVQDIVLNATETGRGMAFAMLYLISYVFLLRLPSEALPVVFSGNQEKS